MSRICVKNLPKYVGEDRLREFFSQKGEITDAKIMRTKDGKSRQFAFVGFRTEQEAEEALRFFNNSYLDTSRIACEVARKVGDPNIPRPWSKHSIKKDNPLSGNNEREGATISNRTSKDTEKYNVMSKTSKSSLDKDQQLQEFLQVMQPRVKSKLWANDTVGASDNVGHDSKANGKGSLTSKNDIKQPAKLQIAVANNNDKLDPQTAGIAGDTCEASLNKIKEPVRDDGISDMEYFRSRVRENWSDTESDDDESSVDDDSHETNAKGHVVQSEKAETHLGPQQDQQRVEPNLKDSSSESIIDETARSTLNNENEHALDTGRLFVRNLSYSTNEDELHELFSKFGEIDNVHLVRDRDTKQSKGRAYVLYRLPESAVKALEELDNSSFQGRLLHILPAEPQNPSTNKVDGQSAKSFKEERQERKKASEISGDTKSWNSFFMRPDTVVENIARKYGVSKSDILDREADDLAVRVALGETHVIAETKKALSNAGVNVSALEKYASKTKENHGRSNHVILVKNLPYGSCEGDLARMFGKFGSLDKIILPPTKALALVIFLEPAEAQAAFKGLAYKCYKDVPIYLEWAPSDILSPSTILDIDEQKDAVGEKEVKKVLLEKTVEGAHDVDLDPDRTESRSIFVKNLNFKTSDSSLKKHFNDNMKKGVIRSVTIVKHIKKGASVSTGYGFIEFDSIETATDVCRDLQGTTLEGHSLILQHCHAKTSDSSKKKIDQGRSSTKLLVKNVAFEATEKDLRQLFSPFGQIKRIRLPTKYSNHRGFAFVEYVTKQEAQNALQALSSTHLYGRHLVLERAKEEENSLQELRKRTAAQFSDASNAFQTLSKKRKHTAIGDESKHKFESIMD